MGDTHKLYPQRCPVRSPGGEGGSPKRNNASRDQSKHRKNHPASNVAAESKPHLRLVAKASANNIQKMQDNLVTIFRLMGPMLAFHSRFFAGIADFCQLDRPFSLPFLRYIAALPVTQQMI